MLRCHLPPGLHKLSRGSCWRGARQAAVALMWVSAGHTPGPGQGIQLEALGARLNYAGGGEEISRSWLCHSSMRYLPCYPSRRCSTLHSRALYLRGSQAGMPPLRGKSHSVDFPWHGEHRTGSAPTTRQHQAREKDALEGMRDPKWEDDALEGMRDPRWKDDALEGTRDPRWSSVTHSAPWRGKAHCRRAGRLTPRRRRSY